MKKRFLLSIIAGLALTLVRRMALVAPYLSEVQERIIAKYRTAGFERVVDRHLGLQENFSFAGVHDTLKRALVAELAAEVGISSYDSVATVTWKALGFAGMAPHPCDQLGLQVSSLS